MFCFENFVFLPRKKVLKKGRNEHNHRQKPESIA